MCNNKKCLIVYEFVKNLLKSAHKDMETNTAHSKFVTFVSKYNTWPSWLWPTWLYQAMITWLVADFDFNFHNYYHTK